MTKNPLINAAAATAYISLVVLLITYVEKVTPDKPTIYMPIAGISLFSLSAAVMAYLFISQPLQMYLDGKKKQGIQLFVQTTLSFAAITAVLFILIFTGVLK